MNNYRDFFKYLEYKKNNKNLNINKKNNVKNFINCTYPRWSSSQENISLAFIKCNNNDVPFCKKFIIDILKNFQKTVVYLKSTSVEPYKSKGDIISSSIDSMISIVNKEQSFYYCLGTGAIESLDSNNNKPIVKLPEALPNAPSLDNMQQVIDSIKKLNSEEFSTNKLTDRLYWILTTSYIPSNKKYVKKFSNVYDIIPKKSQNVVNALKIKTPNNSRIRIHILDFSEYKNFNSINANEIRSNIEKSLDNYNKQQSQSKTETQSTQSPYKQSTRSKNISLSDKALKSWTNLVLTERNKINSFVIKKFSKNLENILKDKSLEGYSAEVKPFTDSIAGSISESSVTSLKKIGFGSKPVHMWYEIHFLKKIENPNPLLLTEDFFKEDIIQGLLKDINKKAYITLNNTANKIQVNAGLGLNEDTLKVPLHLNISYDKNKTQVKLDSYKAIFCLDITASGEIADTWYNSENAKLAATLAGSLYKNVIKKI